MNTRPVLTQLESKVKIIQNANEIRNLAKDVVRMARNEHPMLERTYENFVNASKDSPSFGLVALRKAEFDSYYQFIKESIPRNELKSIISTTREKLKVLENGEIGMKLHTSMQNLHKKTSIKRAAIVAALTEGNKTHNPTSKGKFLKRFFYKLFNYAAKA